MIPIHLKWHRDVAGYRIIPAGGHGESIVRNGGELIPCDPTATDEMLYANFAGLKTGEELLQFVNRHGLLNDSGGHSFGQTYDGELGGGSFRPVEDGHDGELVRAHLESARLIRQVLKAENSGKKSIPTEDGRTLAGILDDDEVGYIRLAPRGKRGFQFIFEASSLMGAIWIQLAQRTGGGVKWGECRYCGSWFEMGPGTGKRTDSEFCKTSHRVAFHRKHGG
jgi:hypothetical protein